MSSVCELVPFATLMRSTARELHALDPEDYGPGIRRAVAARCFELQANCFAKRDAARDEADIAAIEHLTALGREWDRERKRWHVDQQDRPCPRPPPAERLAPRHRRQELRGASLRDFLTARVEPMLRAALAGGGDPIEIPRELAQQVADQLTMHLSQRTRDPSGPTENDEGAPR